MPVDMNNNQFLSRLTTSFAICWLVWTTTNFCNPYVSWYGRQPIVERHLSRKYINESLRVSHVLHFITILISYLLHTADRGLLVARHNLPTFLFQDDQYFFCINFEAQDVNLNLYSLIQLSLFFSQGSTVVVLWLNK